MRKADCSYLHRNTAGRDLVIGDVHGHFSRVRAELDRIGFREDRDRLICCGDLVDRGPESTLAPEWLTYPWFHSVMGNHDAAVLHACGMLSAKFELFINHHGWFEALSSDDRIRVRDALAALPWAMEIETRTGRVGVVHAEVPESFPDWAAFIARLGDEETRSRATSGRDQARAAADLGTAEAASGLPLAGVDWLIQGHTPRPACRAGQRGNRLWIDTLGWYDGAVTRGTPHFTIVDVEHPTVPL